MESSDLNIETRELLVSLAMDLQASTLRAEIYETILEGAETNPSVLSRWRATAQKLYNDADVKERFGMKVAPILDYALRGLSEEDAGPVSSCSPVASQYSLNRFRGHSL